MGRPWRIDRLPCTHTHEHVITAPNPPTLLPKTTGNPSLLAHLVTANFDDNLPLCRVSRQLERSGMDLSPGTAGTWVGGRRESRAVDQATERRDVQRFVLTNGRMDESPVQLLKSEKAPPGARHLGDHCYVGRSALSLLLVGGRCSAQAHSPGQRYFCARETWIAANHPSEKGRSPNLAGAALIFRGSFIGVQLRRRPFGSP